MSKINIQGIDKVKLLEALWQKQIVAGFYANMRLPSPKFDEIEAKKAVLNYIDYFCGRCIKCDISGETADPCLYDRDAGDGVFKKIVDSFHF